MKWGLSPTRLPSYQVPEQSLLENIATNVGEKTIVLRATFPTTQDTQPLQKALKGRRALHKPEGFRCSEVQSEPFPWSFIAFGNGIGDNFFTNYHPLLIPHPPHKATGQCVFHKIQLSCEKASDLYIYNTHAASNPFMLFILFLFPRKQSWRCRENVYR